jgi:RHS repeat-associated protein
LYCRLTKNGCYTSGTLPTQYQYTGQRNESPLGLYYYGARWYDPYITQFSQPDPIIQDPYNPQDWNRYAYVRYNPINNNDPSGYKPCYFDENYGCGWTPSSLQVAKQDLAKYGVSIENGGASWNKDYATELLYTVMEMDYVLNNAFDTYNSFIHNVGHTTVIAEPPTHDKNGNEGFYGWTSGSKIQFYGHLSPQDMIHEFGHRINNADSQGFTNLLDDPDHAVYDVNGSFVTGNTGKGYNRGGNQPAPNNGYRSDSPCPYQCHPRNMDAAGNTANEEWADMFMNFIGNTFAPNPAGDALFSWTITNLATFIK